MTIQYDDPRLQGIYPNQLTQFLLRSGWSRAQHSNDKLVAFEGPKDDSGEPMIVAFPRKSEYRDFRIRLSEIIESLSVILRSKSDVLLRQISHINRDALCAKIVPIGGAEINSVGLKAAFEYIRDLKKLMAHAATTEYNPRAYFTKASSVGSDFADECRFGHTFRGSFGFLVESSSIPEFNVPNPPQQSVFARRVMERLATGFELVREGIEKDDIGFVSNNVQKGLNANLCETVVEMSARAPRATTEFSVAFGGIVEPKILEKSNLSPLVLGDKVVQYLESAAKTLRASVQEKFQEFRGKIVELRSNLALVDDPESVDHIAYMRTTTAMRLRLRLPLSQYLIAIEAHETKRDVFISGTPEKIKKRWILVDPSPLAMP